MDSNKASTSITNSVKSECDNERNSNHKGTPKQAGQSDSDEKLFTSTPNPSSNFVPINGSHSRLPNAVSHESNAQPNRANEIAIESHRNLPNTSNNASSSSKVNSNDPMNDSVIASSSKSSLNTNNGIDPNEGPPVHRHRVCIASSSNAPSTSSTSRGDHDSLVLRENRKRPSSLKLNRPDADNESSSDTGNEDYSLGSEDGCIYTYRGGEHLADLPSSFFSLDMGLPLDRHLPIPPNYPAAQGGNAREGGSRASSPDMDFLEMDFDPGPSCEVDSSIESPFEDDLDTEEEENVLPAVIVLGGPSPEFAAPPAVPVTAPVSVPVAPLAVDVQSEAVPSTSRGPVPIREPVANRGPVAHRGPVANRGTVPSRGTVSSYGDAPEQPHHTWYGPYINHLNARGENLMVRRTMLHWAGPSALHPFNGDLMPPRDQATRDEEFPEGALACRINALPSDPNPVMPTAMYHLIMAKKLLTDKQKEDSENQSSSVAGDSSDPGPSSSTSSISCVEPPRCMIWSERESCERQVTQIGTSACGATAVVNVFNALGVPVNIERINSSVGTRLRANTAPVPRYLLSRAVAGSTAADLVNGIHHASDGLVTARFFPTYPERAMSLSHWLADWISLGAVPILTLNLQNGCDGDIPDAWHHQMVWGVSGRGVYLCNPVECVRETMLWPRLAAPSVLLVRARDVVARFTPGTDLRPLMHVPDPRFHAYNVLGQVVNVLREWSTAGWQAQLTRTRHVRLPASYRAGVTVAALTGSDAHRRLTAARDLPLLHPQNDPA